MENELIVLACAKKHGLAKKDIVHAWKYAKAVRTRNFDIPSIYAAAGPDTHGNLIELLAGEQEDGSFVIFHAMKLTQKMAQELDLL